MMVRAGSPPVPRHGHNNELLRIKILNYFVSFLGVTVTVASPLDISTFHISLSPHSRFNIFITSMGTITLEDFPFISAFPILLSYFSIITSPIGFDVFNSIIIPICILVLFLIVYPTVKYICHDYQVYYRKSYSKKCMIFKGVGFSLCHLLPLPTLTGRKKIGRRLLNG